MDNGDRNVPWGAPADSQGASGPPPSGPPPGWQWGQPQGAQNGQGPDPDGPGGQGGQRGGHGGPGAPGGQDPNPGRSQGGMTAFPLAATGTYSAVRPPEPPPRQNAPQPPPPMTSFPLAATGAYRAVGQQGNPDLSASGFSAPQQAGPEQHNQFTPPPGFAPPPGFGNPPGPPPGDPGSKRRRTLLIGGSVVAVAAVAGGAIFLTTGNSGGSKQPADNSTTATTGKGSATAADGTPSNVSASSAPTSSAPPTTSGAAPPAARPVADVLRWQLNDKPGSKTAVDGSGKNRLGTLDGTVGFSTAHGGSAEFSGAANKSAAGVIKTKGPGIDTTKSFTVSMWVDQTGLTTPTKFAAAFSQDGPQCFAFTFSYSLETKTWSFVRSNADGATPKTVNAGGTAPTPMNVWAKLTGVYDAQAGTIAFFINGQPQGAPVKTNSAPYAATGPFAIGRSWYGKGATNPFKGYISDVQVFGRALSPDEVQAL
ncbi:LamG domain-containing protein [Catenulispora pinisilvae]|uniref:LamG domain-containing protein n=1 Tax=Catenulispora pinisilvae TaxID=2705253 RepID=UPI00189253E6|nr:LamG domain-containing protein [Catenulispora pinisilvae]